jgi:hypothetical protein
MEKQEIIRLLKNISKEQAISDYIKMQLFNTRKLTNETRIGNKFIDFFTFSERLETIGIKGVNYWEFVSMTEYHNKPYIKKLLDYQKETNRYVALYRIFKLHCGSIGLFGPIKAIELLERFKPTSVLEPCMGWGTTLSACCSLNIPYFYGLDTNKNLIEPYKQMTDCLIQELGTSTNINLFFEDALTFDYSKLDYDCIFTSPPFYNKEIYSYTNKKTDDEWNIFYSTLFTETYKYLKNRGHMILHIPEKVYETCCIPLFGIADIILPMKKKIHPKNKRTNKVGIDNIYIWQKFVSLNSHKEIYRDYINDLS